MATDEMVDKWNWGDLPDHVVACSECDGTGQQDDEDDCCECSGDGELRWGSYYEQDEGECGHCRDAMGLAAPPSMPEVGLACMFDSGDPNDDWICLRCYVGMHQRVCGCARWREAENDLLPTRQQT